MRENTAAIRQLFREQVNWRKSFSHQWQEKGKSVSASAVALIPPVDFRSSFQNTPVLNKKQTNQQTKHKQPYNNSNDRKNNTCKVTITMQSN